MIDIHQRCFKSLLKNFFQLLFVTFLFGCAADQLQLNSQPTRIEPYPVKVGGLKDSSIEIAVPVTIEKKKHGGYRSPIEIRTRIMLTRPDSVSIPISPTGGTLGLRVRW